MLQRNSRRMIETLKLHLPHFFDFWPYPGQVLWGGPAHNRLLKKPSARQVAQWWSVDTYSHMPWRMPKETLCKLSFPWTKSPHLLRIRDYSREQSAYIPAFAISRSIMHFKSCIKLDLVSKRFNNVDINLSTSSGGQSSHMMITSRI